MTTGEKIALIRKNNNRTQEEFGDIFQVSRQTIGKWESDTVLPETDKIIAICKRFKVSINWLLGLEEDEYNADADKETLEIISKLNDSNNIKIEKLTRKNKKWLKITTVIMSFLVAIMSIGYISLIEDYVDIDDALDWVGDSDATWQVIYSRDIRDLYAKYDELLAEKLHDEAIYNYTVDYIDYYNENIEMSFNVMPKSFNDSTTVKVEALDLDTYQVTEIHLTKNPDNSFSGKIKVPFCEKVQLRSAITTDSKTIYEVIVNEFDIEKKYTPTLHLSDYYRTPMSGVNFTVQYLLEDWENNLEIKNVSVFFLVDGMIMDEKKYPANYDYEVRIEDPDENYIKIEVPLFVKPKGELNICTLVVVFEDNFGNEYQQNVAQLKSWSEEWHEYDPYGYGF